MLDLVANRQAGARRNDNRLDDAVEIVRNLGAPKADYPPSVGFKRLGPPQVAGALGML